MRSPSPGVIVVGGGLGGLWATLKIAEAGLPVQLFSLFEVKRSHSVCAQGGINAALDVKGQNDSVHQHFVDTIKSGAYLANQPPVSAMCREAPGLIHTFERMGVTFSRTAEGTLDQRLFGGVRKKRTCFAGASTGQQLLYSVDEQVRRMETLGRVQKQEFWELLSLVRDEDGLCRGIVAMDLRSLEVRSFRADAVILATGGMGHIYGRSTNSVNATGAAASRAYQQGACMANLEFFQFHPTAMLGDDKNRLMSEAARGEGGRVWVPRNPGDTRDPTSIPEKERFYFLEEWFPAYGNTVARDVASRAIWKVVREHGLGVRGEDIVYLDLSHLDPKFVETRLGAILEIYRKFTGVDPVRRPMEIFPTAHYAMGGLWVDFDADPAGDRLCPGSLRNHATRIPGLYACGECDYAYHGANRLGANSLLSTAFSGRIAGESAANWAKGLQRSAHIVDDAYFSAETARQRRINEELLAARGTENPYQLHRELGEIMTARVGLVRDDSGLDRAIEELDDLAERSGRLDLGERGDWWNQSLVYARQLQDMIVLGQAMARCARARAECRGAHFKRELEAPIPEGKFPGDPEFERYREAWKANNTRWLKTSVVGFEAGAHRVSYEPVDTRLLEPQEPPDYR